MRRSNHFKLMGLLLLFVVLLTGCGRKVDATTFYTVDIEGMDGYGRANVILDEEGLVKAISEKGKISVDSMEGLFAIGSYMDRLEYSVEPSENLKNGDTVVVKVEFSPNEQDKVKIMGGDIKVKVADLPEGTKIDIFKDVEVVFTGVSPKGSAEVYNKSKDDFVKNVNFSIEPSSNLKIGDKVTVTANYSESVALDHMYIIPSATKEYTVEKLDEYLNSASQIDDATKENIMKEANDIIEAYLVKESADVYYEFTGDYHFNSENFESSFKFDKANLLVAKDPNNLGYGWTTNQLVLFYEVTVKHREKGNAQTGYIALTFNDTIIRDGKLDVVYSDGKVVETKLRKDDIERERLTAFKDKYTIEGVDLQLKKKA